MTLVAVFAFQLASPTLAMPGQILPYDLYILLAGSGTHRIHIHILIGPNFIAGSFVAPNECLARSGFYVNHGLPHSNHTVIKLTSSDYPDPLGGMRAVFPSATIAFTIHPHALAFKRISGTYSDEFGNHGAGYGSGGARAFRSEAALPQATFTGTAIGPFAGALHIFIPGWLIIEGLAILGPPQRDDFTMTATPIGPSTYVFAPYFDQLKGNCSRLTFGNVETNRSGNMLTGTFKGSIPNRDPNSHTHDGKWTGSFTASLQP